MRLLVVEDDGALRPVLVRGLREEGYAVDSATTVADADRALAINDYDLVLLDLGLPDGDGLRLCHEIKAAHAPVRVVVLTARDATADKVGALDAGGDDYVTKPFDFPELAARIRAVLRRPVGPGAPILAAADLRLDPAGHRVWRGEVLVPLTAREFALLHHLMSRPGDVIRRTELLEHVWDANYDGLSNVVDVHIASLRRKLDVAGEPALIETVRGVGYRVRA